MKRLMLMLFVVLICMLPITVMAQGGEEIIPGINLTSIASLIGAGWALTQLLLNFVPSLAADVNRKKLTSLIVIITLGVIAKATGQGFVDITWLNFLLELVVAVAGTKVLHDSVGNPIINMVKASK